VVPPRRPRHPISLSICDVDYVQAMPFPGTPPLKLNVSTFVLDRMNPAEGSMNQLFASAKLYPADVETDAPRAPTCWLNKPTEKLVRLAL
jgi:hypothetical protein